MVQNVKNFLRRLLVRSQEYTGTDNIYIAKQGFWTAFGYGSSSVLAFITVLAFANLLPKEVYGDYKYLLAISGSFGFLMLSGMNIAVARAVSLGQERALQYAVRIQLRWNLLYTLAGLLTSTYYWVKGNWIFAGSMAVIAVSAPFVAAFNTFGPYLTSKKEFRRASLYTILSGIFGSLILIATLFLTHNVIVLIIANSLGSLVPVTYFYSLIQRMVRGPDLSMQEKRVLLRYTGHLSFINVLSIISQYIDKIMTFQYVGPVILATYSFASMGPDRARGWLKSIGGIIFPKVAQRSLGEIDRVFYKRTLQAMTLGLASAIAYSVVAPIVFGFFFPKYLDSIQYSQALSFSLIGVAASIYMGQVFTSQKMISILYIGPLVANTIKILLFIILGYVWGIWGIITAAVISQLFNVAWHAWLWYWHVRRPGGAYSLQ